jgi:hypothetical protein
MRLHVSDGRPVAALFVLVSAGLLLVCEPQPRGQERLALTATEWAEDLEFLSTTIKTRHLNPFAHQSEQLFDRKVAALARALPRMRDDTARMVSLAGLAASIGDGHTSLEIFRGQPLVPIRFFWFGRELRVIGSDTAHRQLLGQRVVRIGSAGLDEAAARLRRLIPTFESENYVLGRLQRLLRMPAILRALDLTATDRELPIVVQSDRGARTLVTLPAMPPDQADAAAVERPSAATPLAQSRPDDGFWFARVPGTAVVYFNFSTYPAIPTMRGTAQELNATLAAGDVRSLLVDMRENLGGNFVAGRRLIDLVREPIESRGITVIVAIGRDTISAGMTNAVDFKKGEVHRRGLRLAAQWLSGELAVRAAALTNPGLGGAAVLSLPGRGHRWPDPRRLAAADLGGGRGRARRGAGVGDRSARREPVDAHRGVVEHRLPLVG